MNWGDALGVLGIVGLCLTLGAVGPGMAATDTERQAEFGREVYLVMEGENVTIDLAVDPDADTVAVSIGDRADQGWELGLLLDTSETDTSTVTLRGDTASVGGYGLPNGTDYDPVTTWTVAEPNVTVRPVYIHAEGMGFRNLYDGGVVPANETWTEPLAPKLYDLQVGAGWNDTAATSRPKIAITRWSDLATLDVMTTDADGQPTTPEAREVPILVGLALQKDAPDGVSVRSLQRTVYRLFGLDQSALGE